MRQVTSDPKTNVPCSALVLWSEWGAVLAGVLFASWGYLDVDSDASPHLATVEEVLGFVVPLLFGIGLAGLYVRFEGRGVGYLGGLGFTFGFFASGWGIVHSVTHMAPWYGYIAARGWPNQVLDWTLPLFASLMLVGISSIKAKALRKYSILPFLMGVFGWAYYFTDTGRFVEIRSAHVWFGVLFSLSWIALGHALWAGRVRGLDSRLLATQVTRRRTVK